MPSNDKPIVYTSPDEVDDISRNVLIWLSDYPDLPVDAIMPEPMLEPGEKGMMLTIIQGSITRRYIVGGHQAELQFIVYYRDQPKGANDRLKIIEMLNRLGNYAVTTKPDLGAGIRAQKCEVTSTAALFAPYDNGDEDYQIEMKLTYEVI